MYGVPVRRLKRILTAQDFAELQAAELIGLVPDPWRQTGQICAAVANFSQRDLEQPAKPDDFIPQNRKHERQDMQQLYWQRKAMYGGRRPD